MLSRKLKIWTRFFYNNYLLPRQKSYSQTGEDLSLSCYFGNLKNGFFVDVGAHDPKYISNTYFFYQQGWSGLCIEPDADKCQLIKSVRPRDTVLNLAVAKEPSNLNYYIFRPDAISTLSEEEAAQYQKLGHELVSTYPVKCLPLKDIFKENLKGREIDLLSVDTEGFDMEVLKSNDWQLYRPKAVIVEVMLYRQGRGVRVVRDFNAYMESLNYKKVSDTYLNAIYLDQQWINKQGLVF